ncbi:putative Syntaxin/t-SNARE family protein [Quillaja saponaria]|uniref:Syntaxin/t-SNARE family protein n=1 Tax=Quillaja saponaria TaxID=32244 RepID=A0AAD7PYK1_QUISA|nr:putative Syntaxin/t-SNARE family protein [Quillaja saponaria]
MASSLHRWESDPLFSAAEVIQDSADRMESIFHLLLHELSVGQGDHPDPSLLTSIEYHRRDLATTLETAKWQLEDFERAVGFSAETNPSQMREDIISRHRQFIRAIREHIIHVEDAAMGDHRINTEWLQLNEQDRDKLASFLSGGNSTEHTDHNDSEESSLRRFLSPTTASNSQDSNSGALVQRGRDTCDLTLNGTVHAGHNYDIGEQINSRKEGFPRPKESSWLDFKTVESLQETGCPRHDEDGSWDLERNEGRPKSFFLDNKLRGFLNRGNVVRFWNNIWTAYDSRITRNYTKRLKDGEGQSHLPSYNGQLLETRLTYFGSLQGLCSTILTKVMYFCTNLGAYRARFQRFPFNVQITHHFAQLTLILLSVLIISGILVFRVA